MLAAQKLDAMLVERVEQLVESCGQALALLFGVNAGSALRAYGKRRPKNLRGLSRSEVLRIVSEKRRTVDLGEQNVDRQADAQPPRAFIQAGAQRAEPVRVFLSCAGLQKTFQADANHSCARGGFSSAEDGVKPARSNTAGDLRPGRRFSQQLSGGFHKDHLTRKPEIHCACGGYLVILRDLPGE